jgi:hypothetical protein
MVTPISLILVVDDGTTKPGMMSVRNYEEAPVPPKVIVACVAVMVHAVIVKEVLPDILQLGVPVGT